MRIRADRRQGVINRNRRHKNVGTKLRRIIKQAGLKPWPKPFHNMRATRCTELERKFPTHVVTASCGHPERIAEAHYWMTTDKDFYVATTLKVTDNVETRPAANPVLITLGNQRKPVPYTRQMGFAQNRIPCSWRQRDLSY